MPVYASLLSTMPVQEQNWKTKSNVPPVASVKVSEVNEGFRADKDPVFGISFLDNLFEKLKQKYTEKRIKKLENIPPEKRTQIQQDELDANKRALNYTV